jgi:hypothetical protein
MPASPANLRQTPIFQNGSFDEKINRKNKVLCTTGNFPMLKPFRDLHVSFKIHYIYTVLKTNYASRKQKPYKSIRMITSAAVDKAKPSTEHTRGLNLAAGRLKTF